MIFYLARDDECTNSQPEGKGEEGKSEKEGEFANGDQSIVNSRNFYSVVLLLQPKSS